LTRKRLTDRLGDVLPGDPFAPLSALRGSRWPLWGRRAYLLTLPIAMPLHAAIWVVLTTVLFALVVLYLVALTCAAACDAVIDFWSPTNA